MNLFLQKSTKKLNLFIFLVGSLFFINNALAAQKSLAIGPEVGSKAPAITVLNNQGGIETIQSLSGEKGLVLVFFRSADWCPFCKKHLMELNAEAEKFTALGYGLAAVSYDNAQILSKFTKEKSISYPLLSDQQAKTVLAYDILNVKYPKGNANFGLPYPGVVVINKAGVVTHKYFFEGYKKRVKFNELYQQLMKKM